MGVSSRPGSVPKALLSFRDVLDAQLTDSLPYSSLKQLLRALKSSTTIPYPSRNATQTPLTLSLTQPSQPLQLSPSDVPPLSAYRTSTQKALTSTASRLRRKRRHSRRPPLGSPSGPIQKKLFAPLSLSQSPVRVRAVSPVPVQSESSGRTRSVSPIPVQLVCRPVSTSPDLSQPTCPAPGPRATPVCVQLVAPASPQLVVPAPAQSVLPITAPQLGRKNNQDRPQLCRSKPQALQKFALGINRRLSSLMAKRFPNEAVTWYQLRQSLIQTDSKTFLPFCDFLNQSGTFTLDEPLAIGHVGLQPDKSCIFFSTCFWEQVLRDFVGSFRKGYTPKAVNRRRHRLQTKQGPETQL